MVSGLKAGTAYVFKAYVHNTEGTAYTSAVPFTTLTSAPVITTPTSSISGTSATLGATVTDSGGLAMTRGVVYAPTSLNSSPALGGAGVVDVSGGSGGAGAFSVSATGLVPGTAYSFRAYASNSLGTAYTTPVSTFTTPNLPTITTPTAAGLNLTSATLGGNITASGGASITERGVIHAVAAENSDPFIGGVGVAKTPDGSTGTGTFTVGATGLLPGTTYSFKAYAINAAGTAHTSPAGTFTTLGLPVMSSPTVTGITPSTATLGGSAAFYAPYSITERGVVYSVTATNSNPVIGGAGVTRVVFPTGSTRQVTGLTPGTGYSFKFYAFNSLGVAYTEPVSTFSTLAGPANPPTLIDPQVVSTTLNGASLRANLTAAGDSPVTERGVVYAITSTNSMPEIGGAGVTKMVHGTNSLGVFDLNPADLAPATKYSFRSYATNSVGTAYTTPVLTFTTKGLPILTLPTSTGVTVTTATLGGSATYTGGYSLTERGIVYSPSALHGNPVIGGLGVTKIVVSGTGTGAFSQAVSDLMPGTQYSFKAYAINSLGTAYTEPVSTFTTSAPSAPSVTSPTSTAVTGASATLGGNVTNDGGGVTERGVVYAPTATNGSPVLGGPGVVKVAATGTPGLGVFTVGIVSLTPGTPYSFCAFARNNFGTTYTSPVSTFTTLTQAQNWRQTHFGTTANTGSAADAFDHDKDGLANLIEYAFGLTPTAADSRLMPQPQHDGSTFGISFIQPASVSGVTYGAQWSTTLLPGSWTDIPDTGSGTFHVFSVPVSTGTQVFVRLVVTAP